MDRIVPAGWPGHEAIGGAVTNCGDRPGDAAPGAGAGGFDGLLDGSGPSRAAWGESMGLRVRGLLVGAVATALGVAAPAVASAEVVGDWQMDEVAGSTLMVDSSGNGLHGDIGPDVVLHEATPTGFGYRFRGDWWIVNPDRLITWEDDDRLDPGSSPYAVTVRFKTGAVDPNIIQKGQNKQSGGFWKLALKKGWPRCHFTDGTGTTRAIGFVNDARPETKVADNQWHTLRCERTATGVKLTIDGTISKFIRGTLGPINNRKPMFLGGKLYCDGTNVTCDYFAGVIDWVTLER
jgi:hypothetical protein